VTAQDTVIIDVLRQTLDRGERVDIEGLGTFRRTQSGYDFTTQAEPQVFVAYVAEDLEPARRLCDSLRAGGYSPWLDKEQLLPGQNWPRAIERAIEASDVFVACFSSRSLLKRGQFQTELRYALDCARQLPLDEVFLIPVRLERCRIPEGILNHVQYADLFPDWERGIRRLLRTIRRIPRRAPIKLTR
jgi:TIR domain-containing protein